MEILKGHSNILPFDPYSASSNSALAWQILQPYICAIIAGFWVILHGQNLLLMFMLLCPFFTVLLLYTITYFHYFSSYLLATWLESTIYISHILGSINNSFRSNRNDHKKKCQFVLGKEEKYPGIWNKKNKDNYLQHKFAILCCFC